ncbi:DUF5683 domain-containing protein [Spirosoma rigui]|uniref:DUF5683 domain-containing protein n=1 Tax=Spirosoma rigui TaxID=564064 RepID=UPI0009B0A00F|nr:DUF5683 domain-containing protein [Spirosoma rigui]
MQQRSSVFSIFFLLLATVGSALAQQPAIAPAPTPVTVDSTRQSRPASDTIPPTVRRNGQTVPNGPVPADKSSLEMGFDTVRVSPQQEAKIRKIIPRKATIRSLIFPGLGQAYNRQYYKMPFVYAGYGALGYYFTRYRRLALEAETGYRRLLYGDDNGTGTNTPVTEVVINESVFRTTTQAKAAYDFYRRYRDLNIILSVVLYAVSAVEANVAAHLKTFDLSDDISLRVEPTLMPMPGTGIVPGARVALSF